MIMKLRWTQPTPTPAPPRPGPMGSAEILERGARRDLALGFCEVQHVLGIMGYPPYPPAPLPRALDPTG